MRIRDSLIFQVCIFKKQLPQDTSAKKKYRQAYSRIYIYSRTRSSKASAGIERALITNYVVAAPRRIYKPLYKARGKTSALYARTRITKPDPKPADYA